MNFTDAKNRLATARNAEAGKPLSNNTRLYNRGKYFAVRLHQTDIIEIHPDHYVLHDGGWKTVTTKARINEYSPARVYTEKGIWYLPKNERFDNNRTVYFDGIELYADGNPRNAKPDNGTTAKRKAKLDRTVARYIKGFLADIAANGLKDPDNGDCFYCSFKEVGTGAAFGDVDHIESHFDESYYVPSLLWTAVRGRGYPDPALIWHMIKADCEQGRKSGLAADSLRGYFRKLKPELLKGVK